jgi:hypothetical protein
MIRSSSDHVFRPTCKASKGYGYEHSNLQDKDLHKLQHKYDDFGKKNTERPVTTEE